MKEIILAKYGEIILKGGNRPKFENILMNNIRNSLKNVAEVKARLAQATIYVEVFDEDKMDIVVERLSKIFGIVSITRAVVCEKDIEDIKAKAKEYLKKDFKDGVKFKSNEALKIISVPRALLIATRRSATVSSNSADSMTQGPAMNFIAVIL